ncbi:DUF3017 domain-containing protein [Nocardioides bruguierae]|uniref:DUF3017 domain-containing protein n=1 Tax=Nocardioides bruguierae TaxID=2945102 RepID=A0A9X2D8Y8_9ACTN|nr:DUF3017 domain-containing protein [Nocardioides bruguierae]MCL8025192.1 DUF3017 domain-containing protein [Nocardioides bruguierae]MCM0621244.1 DUF3017 domain-containing protein [Nocardioides bruguierae]
MDQPASDDPAVPSTEEIAEEIAAVEPRRKPSTIGGAFYILVLLVAVGSLAWAALGEWRAGITVFAGALLAAAALRLVLREVDAGMLAVRSRWIDVTLLSATALAVLALVHSIPVPMGG